MATCSNCQSWVSDNFGFCPRCGTKVEAAEAATSPEEKHIPEPAEALTVIPNFGGPEPKKKATRKVVMLVGVSVLAIIGVAIAFSIPSPFRSPMETETVTFEKAFTAKQLDKPQAVLCDELNGIVESVTYDTYVSRNETLSKVAGYDARKALKFADSHDWIYDSATATSFSDSISTAVKQSLSNLIAVTYPKLNTSWANYQASSLLGQYRSSSLTACDNLASKIDSISSVLNAYDYARNAVANLADSVPWYPQGFTEYYGDSNVAWTWTHGGGCELGDWCWHIKIVSELGCPSNLYAEINILDSAGNVIDYTNDALPLLNPGKVAVMEFSTYNSRSESAQLAKIDCF